jgi:PAS domain-containing protein
MKKHNVALIGGRKAVLRMHRTLEQSRGSQAAALNTVAFVLLDGPAPDEHPVPAYDDWREMFEAHRPGIVLLLDGSSRIKAEIRRNLPEDVELCESLPAQILNASILNQQAFVRKTRTRQHFLESFIQALPIAAILFDSRGQVLYWNQASAELTGMPQEQVLGRTDVGRSFYSVERPLLGQLILASLDLSEVAAHYPAAGIEIKAIPGGIQLMGHLRLRAEIEGYYHVVAQRIVNGERVIGSVQLIQDLSSWHVLQEQLQRQQEQLRTIIGHLPFPLVHTDIRGQVLYTNRAARQSAFHTRLSGPDRLQDLNFLERFPEIDRVFKPHFLSEISLTHPVLTPHQSKTLTIHLKDQEWAVTCLALPEQGKTWTLLWILHNISSKEEQDRLNAAVAMAGAISHELSQPLTAIINSAQLLGRTAPADEERLQRHLKIIAAEGERVLALYQKLHNISKFKLTNYLDMQIFDLEKSADPNLTIDNPQEKNS